VVANGFVIWLTGLSGSGKSTIATMVAARLAELGTHAEILDGDEVRKNLSKGLGFSKADRCENLRRLGFVAKVVARSGTCVIAAAISPYREIRDELRSEIPRFCEVYCECSISVLAARDPKGLYEKALRGEIKNFTGINDPYEAPLTPEVHLKTDSESAEESTTRVIDRLRELGLIGAPAPTKPEWEVTRPPALMQLLTGPAADDARARARQLPAIVLPPADVGMARALGSGLLSPVGSFMTEREAYCVNLNARLEGGQPWPTPITLAVDSATRSRIEGAAQVTLAQADGTPFALLDVHELWNDRAASGQHCVAGRVRLFEAGTTIESAAGICNALAQAQASSVLAIDSAALDESALEGALPAALTFFDAVLLLGSTSAPTRSAHALRILSVPGVDAVPQALRKVVALNCGATHWLVPRAPGQLSGFQIRTL